MERIVQASLELLSTEGPEGVTVQAVVARAGSSVGSFYARFRGKDDLLAHLSERVESDAVARWNEAVAAERWADLDLPEVAERAVALLADLPGSTLAQLRQLDRSRDGSARRRLRQHVLASLGSVVLERQAEMVHDRPEVAVRLGLTAVLGVVEAGLDGWARDIARDEVVQECADLLVAYWSGAAGAAGGPVDFFDWA